MIDLIKHDLYDQEKSEFNNILSLLKSEDIESVELGIELLRDYGEFFPSVAFNFTPFNIGELIYLYTNCKVMTTKNHHLKSIIHAVCKIIDNDCYWYKKCGQNMY